MANVIGALSSEVAVMGTLTNNIHNLFASFYKPDRSKKGRYRIIIEGKAFPSDHVWHPPTIKFSREIVLANCKNSTLSNHKSNGTDWTPRTLS